MSGTIARILLRYLAGFLVAKGALSQDAGAMLAGDADVMAFAEVGIGALIAGGTEAFYWAAKRFGWHT